MAATIILPDWLVHNAKEAPLQGWGVRVVNDLIGDVAPNVELRNKYPDDEVWHAPEQVLVPGFVNAHSHLYGILAHGIPLENAPIRLLAFSGRFLVASGRRSVDP